MKNSKWFAILICTVLMTGMCGCSDKVEKNNDEAVSQSEDLNDRDDTVLNDMVSVQIESIDDQGEQDSKTTETVEKKKNMIRVAVMGAPASEILQKASDTLGFSDYGIEIITCDSYDKPNELVISGEADACLYENQVFLDSYNKKNTTELEIVERSYLEPLAIFSQNTDSIDNIKSGCIIGYPEGEVNKARTLYLLEQKGIITLKEGAYYQATEDSIEDDPYNIALEAYDISQGYPEGDDFGFVVCDYNHAMLSGIDPAASLGEENRNSALTDMFCVCLVTTKDKINSAKIKELSKALNSEAVEEYIYDTYRNSVVDYR